jgi:predicted membrane protein
MLNLCAPALIYVIFSLTQIVIDTIKGLYNTAFLKFIVSIFITILLDTLCKSGMSIISWLIVFIPFIFMTVIVSILLYVFGLDVATGQLNITNKQQKGGNLVFTTSNANRNEPNITYLQLNSNNQQNNSNPFYTFLSSDPQYESFVSV